MKTTTSIILFCIFNFTFGQTLNLQSFGTGFSSPVEITHAGDSRLFVVEQTGRIKILNTNGTVNATSFLNVSTIISTGGERGLLGLAFHPNFTTNGYFFVNYTNTAGNTVIARYSVSAKSDAEEIYRRVYERSFKLRLHLSHQKSGIATYFGRNG